MRSLQASDGVSPPTRRDNPPVQLSELSTRNFRNLAALDAAFPPEGVVVIGDNGHGKTNLLEAIYYLVLFRSLRGAQDRELVRFGEAGFFVAGRADVRVTAGYETARRRKKVTVDRAEIAKLADAVGRITAVALSPGDRAIVAGGPAGRRRYLNVLLSLTAPGYLGHLTAMRHALRQRNAALRHGRGAEARAFDAPFATAAGSVAAARRAWTARWRDRYGEIVRAMGEEGAPALAYRPDHHRESDASEDILRAVGGAFDRDARRATTTVGPHRDDLLLALDGREIRHYGSAGQQRTAAIALRLVEAEALREARAVPPIGLYDDVFAELDARRQAALLELIRDTLPGQAIITAPRDVEVPAALLDRPRWTMRGGRLDG